MDSEKELTSSFFLPWIELSLECKNPKVFKTAAHLTCWMLVTKTNVMDGSCLRGDNRMVTVWSYLVRAVRARPTHTRVSRQLSTCNTWHHWAAGHWTGQSDSIISPNSVSVRSPHLTLGPHPLIMTTTNQNFNKRVSPVMIVAAIALLIRSQTKANTIVSKIDVDCLLISNSFRPSIGQGFDYSSDRMCQNWMKLNLFIVDLYDDDARSFVE